MTIAYIALGSNLAYGGLVPAEILDAATSALGDGGTIVARSGLYATDPVGAPGPQPRYLNAVVALATLMPPIDLLQTLLAIEQRFGRDRTLALRNASRTLDLDLLLYGSLVIQTERLTLPHPRLAERRFVLAPLAEIAPTLLHPVTGETMRALFAQLPETGENGPDAVRRLT